MLERNCTLHSLLTHHHWRSTVLSKHIIHISSFGMHLLINFKFVLLTLLFFFLVAMPQQSPVRCLCHMCVKCLGKHQSPPSLGLALPWGTCWWWPWGGCRLLVPNADVLHHIWVMSPCLECAQEAYCFILPFLVKWVVAALLTSVLVRLFSRLRGQADCTHISILARACSLLHEWWQCMVCKAPISKQILVTMQELIGRCRTPDKFPTVTR